MCPPWKVAYMSDETVLCPDCGWTGNESELDEDGDGYSCPICNVDIGFVG